MPDWFLFTDVISFMYKNVLYWVIRRYFPVILFTSPAVSPTA